MKELETMKQLKPHPHVIKLLECVMESGEPTMIQPPVVSYPQPFRTHLGRFFTQAVDSFRTQLGRFVPKRIKYVLHVKFF